MIWLQCISWVKKGPVEPEILNDVLMWRILDSVYSRICSYIIMMVLNNRQQFTVLKE
jgi:hypothetical protein